MAHGITLTMRAIKRPEPELIHQHPMSRPGVFGGPVGVTYINPDKDRSLPGKARRRARKAAK